MSEEGQQKTTLLDFVNMNNVTMNGSAAHHVEVMEAILSGIGAGSDDLGIQFGGRYSVDNGEGKISHLINLRYEPEESATVPRLRVQPKSSQSLTFVPVSGSGVYGLQVEGTYEGKSYKVSF